MALNPPAIRLLPPPATSLCVQPNVQANSFKATLALAWGSLGVIYGDIGTSPMYVLSSIFPAEISPTVDDIKGGMSLIFWTITLIVVVKYVLVVMRADDDGQGMLCFS